MYHFTRADLGAMINRLQFNIENLNSQSTALTDAASRIEGCGYGAGDE